MLVSLFDRLVPGVDEEGRLTGQNKVERSRQLPLLANVSAARGSAENSQFGQQLDYDRTVLIDNPDYPIAETAVLWIDCGVREKLVDGGYFDRHSVNESGNDLDGGGFDDWDDCDSADAGGFEWPTWTDEPYDYVVRKVARTANYTAVAVKRVEVSR